MLKSLTCMRAHNAHIARDQLRLVKHLRVDTLQYNAGAGFKPVLACFQCYQVRAIDIAISKLTDINDFTGPRKLLCNGNQTFHKYAS
jgi:hypothetical protein